MVAAHEEPGLGNLAAQGILDVLHFMNAQDLDERSVLKENLIRLDTLRGESYRQTLPEVDAIWSPWNAAWQGISKIGRRSTNKKTVVGIAR